MGRDSDQRFEARLLGGVHLRLGDAPLPALPSHRTLLVLVALIVARRPLRRERLASWFWPDRPPKTGRTNLRVALHALRKVLGDRITGDRNTAGFESSEGDRVDLYESDGTGVLCPGLDPEGCDGFAEWLEHERDTLRRKTRERAVRVGRERLEAGAFAEAEALARAAIESAPDSIEAHRLLIDVLSATSRRAALERHRRALASSFGGSAPTELTALARTALGRVSEPTIGFVPVAADPLVGRRAELAELDQLLSEHRLVTVVGLGGTGKTRLSQSVAAAFGSRDGSWFVRLRDRDTDVAAAVAHVLGLPAEGSGRGASDRVIDAIRERELLLVLDNAEVVEDAVASWVSEALQHARGCRILVTSRRPLDLRSERVFQLGGLTDPDEARQLFVRREPAAAEDADLGRLLDRLGGLPLGIELAAAMHRRLGSTRAVLEQVERRALRGTERDRPERHRTLDAAMAGTWELLAPEARAALARLATFHDAFDPAWLDDAVADLLPDLSQSGTVVDLRGGRHVVHGLVRAFALARGPDPDGDRAWHRAGTADRLARSTQALYGPGHARALDTLRAIRSDVLGAWDQALDRGEAASLASWAEPLKAAAGVVGWVSEAIDRLLRAIAQHDHPDFRVAAAMLLGHHGDPAEGLVLLADLDDPETQFTRATLALQLGRLAEARSLVERLDDARPETWNLRALIATRSGEDERADELYACGQERVPSSAPGLEARLLHGRAGLARRAGDLERAMALHERALVHRRRYQAPRGLGLTLVSLAACEAQSGQLDRARERLLEARRIAWDIGDPVARSLAEHNLGCLELEAGDPLEALGRLDAAVALRRRSSNPADLAYSLSTRAVALARMGRTQDAGADLDEATRLAQSARDARLDAQLAAHRAEVRAR